MFSYPVVLLSSFWFGVAYMMHVGIAAEIPLIFAPAPYNFSELEVGLSAFSGLIDALVGEAFAGPMLDAIAKRSLRRELPWKPELRLQAIWPALVAVPTGLVMFGVSIQFSDSWVPALVGQGIFIFGIEIAPTVVYDYPGIPVVTRVSPGISHSATVLTMISRTDKRTFSSATRSRAPRPVSCSTSAGT